MVSSQGVTPVDLVPSAYRLRPSVALKGPSVESDKLQVFLAEQEKQLHDSFSAEAYHNLPEWPNLAQLELAIGAALKHLSYPKGREVRRVKKLWGLTRLMGLAYGGPAYHDVISAEVVVASHEDLPSSKFWKWTCVAHEVVHAQGFTREMDTEIITWLAFYLSTDPMKQNFARMMLLQKSGQEFQWPAELLGEFKRVREERKKVQAEQWLVSFFRTLGESSGVQNSGAKYGTVSKGKKIPEDHEFFRSVYKMAH
ncbi:MAG: hypothetical protein HQL32_00055 [Planctomycetes bacterium]|nr:hypothetical protein [Planctomycetota bacterium]